jgi:DNA-binding IclR family transcriptional regulator
LLACALPHLRDLAAASGRPVTLGVLWQLTLFPVYHGDAATPLETTITGGPPRRADRCASGRVLLAARPPRELLALLDAEGYAEDERPELLLDLAEIRGRQYAVQADRNALAVSVGTGPAAGLALHGPVTDDLLPALLGHLRATARQITESLLRHRP